MTVTYPGFATVPEFMPDADEHRRRIARALNTTIAGKVNAYIDVTLTHDALTTTITDPRISPFSAVFPAMPTTADGAGALARGIWITTMKKGSCVANHSSVPSTTQTIRFLIVG